MSSVFLLQHSYQMEELDCEETKVIGIYSTREHAEQAQERLKRAEGFRDYPDCFYIDKYVLDKDHWVEGFVRV